jgi:hypothetical protein
MGWEQRGNGSYYYRKKREGRRVRSEYVGGGAVAQECAKIDRNKRRCWKTERDAIRSARQADAKIDRHLATVEAAISVITNANLYADGYHKHKGQWRKKRHEKKATAGEKT